MIKKIILSTALILLISGCGENKKDENKRLLKHLQEGKSAETFNFKYLNVNLDKTIENSYTTLI